MKPEPDSGKYKLSNRALFYQINPPHFHFPFVQITARITPEQSACSHTDSRGGNLHASEFSIVKSDINLSLPFCHFKDLTKA